MPFPFVYLCDLLNDLERPHVSRYPMLPKDLADYTKDKVIRWLRLHRDRLNAFSTDSEAVMSMLQPEKQVDRVYSLDSHSLERVIARALALPRQHYLDLQQWKIESARGDLGACVKRVIENLDNVSGDSLDMFTCARWILRFLVTTTLLTNSHGSSLTLQSKQSLTVSRWQRRVK
jgi:hypothetical protein